MSHKDAQVITVQTTQKAKLNESKCIHCMECITDEFCTFNAIKWNETKQIPIIDPIACEGCNGCSLLCDAKAFEIFPVDSGTITKIESDYGFSVITGETILGAQTSGKLVTELKKYASDIISEEGAEIVLYDGPPGIGCPVIASLAELDYVIVIIEPTGAALHDAQRLIEVVENFKIPYGVILNKADIWNEGAQKIQEYLDKNQIELLGKIPLIKDWPYSVAKRIPIVKYGDEHNHYSVRYFKTIVDKIVKDIIQ